MTASTRTSLLDPAARAAGSVLGATAGTLGQALHRVKPLHPDGRLHQATITRVGARGLSAGAPWIETPGESPAIVRVSRAIGLPQSWPDIAGLAIRVDPGGAAADLLLASTGTGRLGRFLLQPRRPGRTGTLTSLLPYRTSAGPLLLAAVPNADGSYDLRWAIGTGRWQTFGLLHLGAAFDDDPEISFDPVLNLLPGLAQYDWVRRLREPAYQASRSQSERGPVTQPLA